MSQHLRRSGHDVSINHMLTGLPASLREQSQTSDMPDTSPSCAGQSTALGADARLDVCQSINSFLHTAGGFQEALTDSFTGHLRDLGGRTSADRQLPQAADTGALRGAVRKLRDAERAPPNAPKARDYL